MTEHKLATKALHAGQEIDATNSRGVPIYPTANKSRS